METLGPASELDAVCELLASVGEDPVEDIENLPPSGNTALTTLRATSRSVQEDGYWFNSETVTFSPTVDGTIPVPPNALDMDGTGVDAGPLGTLVFNRETRTHTFTSPTEFEVIWHREWAELPSVVRRYVTALAIERFVEGFPGADPTSASRQRNLMRATLAFQRAELRNGDFNLLNNTSIQTLVRR